MDSNIILCVVFLTSIASGSCWCQVKESTGCVSTIVCEGHAGQVSMLPSCEADSSPYVTLVLVHSFQNTLTTGFFSATNFDSRVREIKAHNNSWDTIETAAFKFYFRSLHMDLSYNEIKYLKNEAFKNMYNLESLNLSRNAIEILYPKSLKIAGSSESNLHVLDLSYNMLTDIPSEALNSFSELVTLYLQGNKLMTLADDCFLSLKNLNSLYLQHNRLTTLNMTLINLKELKEIDLSFNSLKQLLGYELNRLQTLEHVNISYNDIETMENTCFNQAFHLQVVDLKCNKIKSPIDNITFSSSNKLEYLNLYNNSINHIDDNAFKYNTLNYLNLEKNKLNQAITSNTFSGLFNITTINLADQSITAVKNNAFSEMTVLLSLNISKNKINVIENSSFANANALKILDVSHNNLSNLNFLQNCSFNLTELYLNDNSLAVIPKGVFDMYENIIKLDISMNKIKTIEQYSLPLKNLQYLTITGNNLTGIIKNNVFSPAKFLRSLDVSNFNFKAISKEAFVDLVGLARLNLSYNKINYIDSTNFKGLDNLYSLDLSHNQLTYLKINNSNLKNLKAVYLNNNKLTNISVTFKKASEILYLDISHNEISNLSDNIFRTLGNLKVLQLSHNKITNFNTPEINSLAQLTDLNLSSNQLTGVNLSYFKELVSVDISNNNFSSIDHTFFQNLDYLQSLDISNNKISELLPGTFQNVIILKLLNFSSNNLSNLRYGTFKGLHRTKVLDISRNHIAELDVHLFHECTELERLIIDYNQIKSLDVESLIQIAPKLEVISIGGNPVSCKEIVTNIKYIKRPSMRHVEVTSVDKIYHEDNVYGIKCGDINSTNTTENPKEEISSHANSNATSHVILGWCIILTILIIIGAVFYFYRRGYFKFNTHPRMQLRRSSMEFSQSECQSDLLS